MEPNRTATPGTARPLALLGGLLVIAATTYALLVGCGGKSQENSTSSSTETSSAPTSTATSATPNTAPGDTAGEAAMDPLVLGNKIYQERCALCHGPEGKGDGPAAAGLNPKPRNHTDGTYMKTRTDDQLLDVIRHGKGGMPAWGGILNETEIHAVLKHVRTLAK
jgi:mono/diheme cytochrome c family protein